MLDSRHGRRHRLSEPPPGATRRDRVTRRHPGAACETGRLPAAEPVLPGAPGAVGSGAILARPSTGSGMNSQVTPVRPGHNNPGK
ncbi:hypothetical protein GCM10009530_57610 [Microbispora corallina]|uniref:Uncharacterized protein n=1 Tax=Microbispora corallina TaxID=83302 RepID=A0ABQ4G3T9_9ACTN|nr:hypothetical protein Mco01_47050 [Microbispora corallina]